MTTIYFCYGPKHGHTEIRSGAPVRIAEYLVAHRLHARAWIYVPADEPEPPLDECLFDLDIGPNWSTE